MSSISRSPTPLSHVVGVSKSATPLTQASPQAVQSVQAIQPETVPAEKTEDELLQAEQSTLDELRQIELLPLLLDLVEGLKIGRISPKDFDNAAGRIRVRLSRMRTLLNGVDGLDESHESRLAKMKNADERIAKKRAVLQTFRESVAQKLDF